MHLKLLAVGLISGIAALAVLVPVALADSPPQGDNADSTELGPKTPHRRGGPAAALAGGRHRGAESVADIRSVAAEQLGLTPAELRAALAPGDKSILDVAREKNLNADQFTTDVAAAVRAVIQQAIRDGRMDQAKADRLLANLDGKVAAALSAKHGARGEKDCPPKAGAGGRRQAPAQAASPQT